MTTNSPQKSKLLVFVCGVMMTISLCIFPFGCGPYVLELLDQWSANWSLLLIALLECYAVAWMYGLVKISYDIHLMTGRKPHLFVLICWKYIAPISIILILVGTIIEFIVESVNEGGIKYKVFQPRNPQSKDGDLKVVVPPVALAIGFFLMIFCVIWVPVYAGLRNTKYRLLKPEAQTEFPEEKLRSEQNINVEKEEDQFTPAEKTVIGQRSLTDLQLHREKVKSQTSLKSKSKNNVKTK